MPDGISWNLNSPSSVITVCPALFPPCERMTICALAARKSMTFPLPSSPHWPPTRMMTMRLLGPGFGPASLEVVEARVIASELELDHPGGPVSVLGQNHLCNARSLFRFIVLWSIKKHDNITVLFYRARFSQVAEDWPLVRTLFGGATELR